jgi:hypothetical protein
MSPAAINEDFIILLLVKLVSLYSRFTIGVWPSIKFAQQMIKDSTKQIRAVGIIIKC